MFGGAIYISGNYSITLDSMANCYLQIIQWVPLMETLFCEGTVIFANNTKGAAVSISTGSVSVSGRALFYNNEGSLGGGMKLSVESYAFLNGMAIEFRGNSAGKGGGIYLEQSIIFSSNGCMTFNNTARGIAVYGDNLYTVYKPISSSKLLISGNFVNNTAKNMRRSSLCAKMEYSSDVYKY